ncbi:hypothetical protein LTR53_012325 [Teratosphaeriaceae sp. CCFEE 6253]|nr:hypothetical protein LTR53_012325 [Teratosphaeriaceae sp. CCFEE 6253]
MRKTIAKLQGRMRRAGKCVRRTLLKSALFVADKARHAPERQTGKRLTEQSASSEDACLGPSKPKAPSSPSYLGQCRSNKDDEKVDTRAMPAEAEEDGQSVSYLEGSSRLGLVCDGVKHGIAIIPDAYLIDALKDAIYASRYATRGEKIEIDRRGELFDLLERIEEREAVLDTSVAQGDVPEDRKAELQRQLEVLRERHRQVLEAHRACSQAVDEQFLNQKDNLENLVYMFERILAAGNLVSPEEDLDDADDEASAHESAVSVHTSSSGASHLKLDALIDATLSGQVLRHKARVDDLRGSETESETGGATRAEKERLILEYRSQRSRLQAMEDIFDVRDDRFDGEANERALKIEAGEEVESTLAFDHEQLETTRRMTRQIIDAEEALDSAKMAAIAAGVQVPGSEVESGFVDDVDDGYRTSLEEEMVRAVDREGIEKWMALAPEGYTDDDVDVEVDVDVDDWAARSMDLCDSASMRALGPERRRIDIWRAICPLDSRGAVGAAET